MKTITEEESLLYLTKSRNRKKQKEWFERAKKGEVMRIL